MLASMPARVAILTPFASPSVRGNAVTVARVALGLRERGIELRVWDLGSAAAATVETEVEAYRPALIHAFHARRVGPLAARLARRIQAPLVVTLTGTDANHDLVDPGRGPSVRGVLDGAARVTAFHASIVERVTASLPELRERLVVVPQAVRLPAGEDFDLRARWPLPSARMLFVFPAGVRAVKNPLFPLAPLGRAVAAVPEIRLAYAGPLLDPDVGESLQRALATRPWARHLGVVRHSAMASLLSQADVVLNCSVSDGGMANSVLEALSLGRAVLASDIEGNRSVVDDGSTGFLFRDEVELEARATELARDPALRERLGRAGRELVARRYPPEREVEGYRAVYASLVPVLA
jgi:glycosyltransferase involved in cell wall biosynthesis